MVAETKRVAVEIKRRCFFFLKELIELAVRVFFRVMKLRKKGEARRQPQLSN